MFMYPVIPTRTSQQVTSENNHTGQMPRNRSLSAASATSVSNSNSNNNNSNTSTSPALLSRGFASLRRAHRRLSNSSPITPTSPTSQHQQLLAQQEQSEHNNSSSLSSSDRPSSIESFPEKPRMRLVPNVGLSTRSFVFDIIDKELEPGVIYRIGRFSDRNAVPDRLSFKSKVVSRNHAELWAEQGKVYLRDIGSSSGTFLNRIRLSPPSHVSPPHEIKDGDTIQLGVDYQGGLEPIYRAVRIRVELNRQQQTADNPFTRTAFQQLRSHLIAHPAAATGITAPAGHQSTDFVQPADLGLHREPTKVDNATTIEPSSTTTSSMSVADMASRMPANTSRADIQECCICLYAIAPFQALFIAPCSHIFHFKCLRPIVFQNYPGFSCPLCRSYFDLEASVAVEVDEVLEALEAVKQQEQQQQQQQQKQKTHTRTASIDPVPELNEEEEEDEELHGETTEDTNMTSPLERMEISSPVVCVTTPPVPYIEEEEDEDEGRTASITPSATSLSQAIFMNHISNNSSSSISSSEQQHLQTQANGRSSTATNRQGETLLSTTLVGSPVFDTNMAGNSTATTNQ